MNDDENDPDKIALKVFASIAGACIAFSAAFYFFIIA